MQSVHDIAAGKWDVILAEYGVDTDNRKNRPCPICGGKDRFRYVGGDFGKWVCTHCTNGAYKSGMDLVLMLTGDAFANAASAVERLAGVMPKPEPKPKTDPAIRLRKVWSQCGPIDVEVVDYLASRGLRPAEWLKQARLPLYEDGRNVGIFPAMVARVDDNQGPVSLHITYLLPDGKRRKMLPPIRPASAVFCQLYPVSDTVGVAEGVETAIAAGMIHGVRVWPCFNANSLERFEPPEGVSKVVIFGDADASYTGQAAAFAAAKRLKAAGYGVEVRLPDAGDWADQIVR